MPPAQGRGSLGQATSALEPLLQLDAGITVDNFEVTLTMHTAFYNILHALL